MTRCLKYSLLKNFTWKTNRQTNGERKPFFFYLNHTWVTLAQARRTLSLSLSLSYMSLFLQRKRERGWGVLLCLLSVARKTFPNWKLRNHKSDVNETCLTYVPPQHLSFAFKWAWQLMAGQGRTQKIDKKCNKNHKLSTLTSRKNSFKNAMKVGFVLLSSWTISL